LTKSARTAVQLLSKAGVDAKVVADVCCKFRVEITDVNAVKLYLILPILSCHGKICQIPFAGILVRSMQINDFYRFENLDKGSILLGNLKELERSARALRIRVRESEVPGGVERIGGNHRPVRKRRG